jgi:hypothetical protein
MHIELLWLVPILALAVFIFFISLYLQRRWGTPARSTDLHREVELFNAGNGPHKPDTAKSADERLGEMEKLINVVAEAVAGERRPFQGTRKEGAVSADEAGELREKLRSVFKEYDIILSENYTLRAKVKQLARRIQELENAGVGTASFDSILTRTTAPPRPAMRLYDDTRLINLASMDSDDLSESDDAIAR